MRNAPFLANELCNQYENERDRPTKSLDQKRLLGWFTTSTALDQKRIIVWFSTAVADWINRERIDVSSFKYKFNNTF